MAFNVHRLGLNNLSGAHVSAEHGTAYVGRFPEYNTSRRKYGRHVAPCAQVFTLAQVTPGSDDNASVGIGLAINNAPLTTVDAASKGRSTTYSG